MNHKKNLSGSNDNIRTHPLSQIFATIDGCRPTDTANLRTRILADRTPGWNGPLAMQALFRGFYLDNRRRLQKRLDAYPVAPTSLKGAELDPCVPGRCSSVGECCIGTEYFPRERIGPVVVPYNCYIDARHKRFLEYSKFYYKTEEIEDKELYDQKKSKPSAAVIGCMTTLKSMKAFKCPPGTETAFAASELKSASQTGHPDSRRESRASFTPVEVKNPEPFPSGNQAADEFFRQNKCSSFTEGQLEPSINDRYGDFGVYSGRLVDDVYFNEKGQIINSDCQNGERHGLLPEDQQNPNEDFSAITSRSQIQAEVLESQTDRRCYFTKFPSTSPQKVTSDQHGSPNIVTPPQQFCHTKSNPQPPLNATKYGSNFVPNKSSNEQYSAHCSPFQGPQIMLQQNREVGVKYPPFQQKSNQLSTTQVKLSSNVYPLAHRLCQNSEDQKVGPHISLLFTPMIGMKAGSFQPQVRDSIESRRGSMRCNQRFEESSDWTTSNKNITEPEDCRNLTCGRQAVATFEDVRRSCRGSTPTTPTESERNRTRKTPLHILSQSNRRRTVLEDLLLKNRSAVQTATHQNNRSLILPRLSRNQRQALIGRYETQVPRNGRMYRQHNEVINRECIEYNSSKHDDETQIPVYYQSGIERRNTPNPNLRQSGQSPVTKSSNFGNETFDHLQLRTPQIASTRASKNTTAEQNTTAEPVKKLYSHFSNVAIMEKVIEQNNSKESEPTENFCSCEGAAKIFDDTLQDPRHEIERFSKNFETSSSSNWHQYACEHLQINNGRHMPIEELVNPPPPQHEREISRKENQTSILTINHECRNGLRVPAPPNQRHEEAYGNQHISSQNIIEKPQAATADGMPSNLSRSTQANLTQSQTPSLFSSGKESTVEPIVGLSPFISSSADDSTSCPDPACMESSFFRSPQKRNDKGCIEQTNRRHRLRRTRSADPGTRRTGTCSRLDPRDRANPATFSRENVERSEQNALRSQKRTWRTVFFIPKSKSENFEQRFIPAYEVGVPTYCELSSLPLPNHFHSEPTSSHDRSYGDTVSPSSACRELSSLTDVGKTLSATQGSVSRIDQMEKSNLLVSDTSRMLAVRPAKLVLSKGVRQQQPDYVNAVENDSGRIRTIGRKPKGKTFPPVPSDPLNDYRTDGMTLQTFFHPSEEQKETGNKPAWNRQIIVPDDGEGARAKELHSGQSTANVSFLQSVFGWLM